MVHGIDCPGRRPRTATAAKSGCCFASWRAGSAARYLRKCPRARTRIIRLSPPTLHAHCTLITGIFAIGIFFHFFFPIFFPIFFFCFVLHRLITGRPAGVKADGPGDRNARSAAGSGRIPSKAATGPGVWRRRANGPGVRIQ